MPSVNRPSSAAWAVSACWAITTGWRGNVGTTAVPISIRDVSRPTATSAVMASKENAAGIQRLSNPSRSTSPARSIRPAMVRSALAPSPTVIPDPHGPAPSRVRSVPRRAASRMRWRLPSSRSSESLTAETRQPVGVRTQSSVYVPYIV